MKTCYPEYVGAAISYDIDDHLYSRLPLPYPTLPPLTKGTKKREAKQFLFRLSFLG